MTEADEADIVAAIQSSQQTPDRTQKNDEEVGLQHQSENKQTVDMSNNATGALSKVQTVKVSETKQPGNNLIQENTVDAQTKNSVCVNRVTDNDIDLSKLSVEDAHVYKLSNPNCLTRLMVNCPCCLMLSSLVVMILVALFVF